MDLLGQGVWRAMQLCLVLWDVLVTVRRRQCLAECFSRQGSGGPGDAGLALRVSDLLLEDVLGVEWGGGMRLLFHYLGEKAASYVSEQL